MAYSFKVVREFVDKHDNKKYEVGDQFPTDISKKRINELFHKQNEFKEQYIALDVDSKSTKAELLEIAKDFDLEVSEHDTKADIVKVLRDNMAALENVKMLLSITDDKQDNLLKIIINNTEKRLISLLPLGVDKVPERLQFIVEEVAVKRFNRVGAEGMTSESVDGRSNTFQDNDFDEYKDIIDAQFPRELEKRGTGVFY